MKAIHPRRVQSASRSDVGRVRPANQDACSEFENAEGYRLFVVADGMGGHRGGETASRLAIESIGITFAREFIDPETLLVRAFRAANQEIHRTGCSDPALHGMGTTGVALLIGPHNVGWVANVGDSRAYRLRGERFERITEDHSWVFEEVRRGRITADEAREHPLKNVLLQSIGSGPNLEVSTSAIELQAGDRFLLCSDGLWGEVDDAAIAEILARELPSRAVDALVELANANGGSDNVTVQVAELLEADQAPAVAIGIDGPIELPDPHRFEPRSREPADAARAKLPGGRRLWQRPLAVAAGLFAATALFWRICA